MPSNPSEYQRPYYRQWYEQNKTEHKKNVALRRERLWEDCKQRLWDILTTSVCVDCGEDNPIVLDFDHVRGKKRSGVIVLARSGVTWATVVDEIAKCDVRCANCHRIVTARRGVHWRHEAWRKRLKAGS